MSVAKSFLEYINGKLLAKMALAALVAISGPKKSQFQGPPLIMALVMDIARLRIIMYRANKNKRYINSYWSP